MEDEYLQEKIYYHITVVSRIVNLSTQTILRYERLGLIQCETAMPSDPARHRCYSTEMLDRLKRIKWLTEDLGINLAGVEVILQLLDRLGERR